MINVCWVLLMVQIFLLMEVGHLQTNMRIFILGGGPAGISLSHYLSELEIKNTLIEARNNVGGMARSWEWNNFIVDTGPHILHTDDKEIWERAKVSSNVKRYTRRQI